MPAVAATVRARPVVMTRVGRVVGVIVFLAFIVIAFVMKRFNAGVTFETSDQIGTAVLGVLAGAAFLPLAHPRLEADADSLRIRGFFGAYRTIGWDLVRAVEFPASVRFARVRFAGEETLAIYAIQRADAAQSIAAMEGLRALLAASRER